ncbi:MAG: hypothetical protein EOO22_04785 [Comamonadaceae bacterium]|nr:MAG: hypothetical protein EOO22_04785 [Comamonadaceae bacterium]
MFSASSLLRFLSLPAWGLRSTSRQTSQIRHAMLHLLQSHGGHVVQRVAQRVRFADDLETLWYLRQDVLLVLADADDARKTRREMRAISRLFKGWLPETMGPRTHHRFTA